MGDGGRGSGLRGSFWVPIKAPVALSMGASGVRVMRVGPQDRLGYSNLPKSQNPWRCQWLHGGGIRDPPSADLAQGSACAHMKRPRFLCKSSCTPGFELASSGQMPSPTAIGPWHRSQVLPSNFDNLRACRDVCIVQALVQVGAGHSSPSHIAKNTPVRRKSEIWPSEYPNIKPILCFTIGLLY